MLYQFTGANAGTRTLGFGLPNTQNLKILHIPTLTYSTGQPGATVQNLAYPGAPASVLGGSPTMDANGLSFNAFGDALTSSVVDIQSDLTVGGIFQCADIEKGASATPTFITTFNQDTGAPLAGAKGFTLGMNAANANAGTIQSITRASNVATVTLTGTPPSPAYVTGQTVMITGVTGDTSFNTAGAIMTVVSPTVFTYPSIGANGSGTVSAAYSWNGTGQLSILDTINTPASPAAISSAVRSGSTVTLTVPFIPSGLTPGGPVTVAGITGDLTMNGTFTALTASGTTITYTSTGPAGSGVVTNATAAFAVLTKLNSLLLPEVVFNVPRFLVCTIVAATGVRTLYDFSAGSPSPVSQTNVGARLGTIAPQPLVFGTGLFGSAFGKFKMFAGFAHIGTALTAGQLQQNYGILAAKTGFG